MRLLGIMTILLITSMGWFEKAEEGVNTLLQGRFASNVQIHKSEKPQHSPSQDVRHHHPNYSNDMGIQPVAGGFWRGLIDVLADCTPWVNIFKDTICIGWGYNPITNSFVTLGGRLLLCLWILLSQLAWAILPKYIDGALRILSLNCLAYLSECLPSWGTVGVFCRESCFIFQNKCRWQSYLPFFSSARRLAFLQKPLLTKIKFLYQKLYSFLEWNIPLQALKRMYARTDGGEASTRYELCWQGSAS